MYTKIGDPAFTKLELDAEQTYELVGSLREGIALSELEIKRREACEDKIPGYINHLKQSIEIAESILEMVTKQHNWMHRENPEAKE